MERSHEAAERIRRIEIQQDEILRELEELELRTAAVLAEYAPKRSAEAVDQGPAGTDPAEQAARPPL